MLGQFRAGRALAICKNPLLLLGWKRGKPFSALEAGAVSKAHLFRDDLPLPVFLGFLGDLLPEADRLQPL